VFPDFTAPRVREWWHGLYHDLYVGNKVSGFWNDMNEPAVFKINRMTFPDEVRHDMDGVQGDHKRAHNIYGMQMSRASYEGLKRLKPQKRPFLLTRATFSGGQRYAAIWTGDNYATWEHLRLANIQCQRLSISGFSFVGTDIGGFAEQPSGELFIRWLQLGVFHPLFRVHSMGSNVDGASEVDQEAVRLTESLNRMDQEPWSFGEPYTSLARQAIEFRYQLLPYLYTAFWKNTIDGTPILKSLVFYDQTDTKTIDREQEFIFGEHLLVCPILSEGRQSQMVYVPKGSWYNFFSGARYEGNQLITFDTVDGHIPVLVQAGAIIPLYPVQQYTGQKTITTITLKCFYGANTSQLYLDGEEGYGYQEGDFSLRTFNTNQNEARWECTQAIAGQAKSLALTHFRIELHGWLKMPKRILADGTEIDFDINDQVVILEVEANFKSLQAFQ
jgi:alpha-glucosidase